MYIDTLQGCCAVQEIIELQDLEGSGEEVLQQILDYNYKSAYGRSLVGVPNFILFTSVEKVAKSEVGKVKTGYGSRLANYIKKERLGVITASPKRVNRLNNPTHTVVVWVWCPSIKKLEAWYKARR